MNLSSGFWRALLAGGLLAPALAGAQDIPKGAVVMAELGQGFNHAPGGDALYLATLQVVPQWTILPGRLRAGLVLGAFYPGTRVGGLAGGRVTVKLFQGPPVLMGNSFHVHLLGEYLPAVWAGPATWRQWVGAGIGLETSNLVGIALKVHRDFRTPATYGQLALAFNLRYKASRPPEL